MDGPYSLTAFDPSSGAFTLTPNIAYGGPHARKMSILRAISFTSPEAEFDAVRAGAVDVGFIPLIDVTRVGAVKARGYNVFGYPSFAFNYMVFNFLDKTGRFNSIIAQLYVRQAIAHLEDQGGAISRRSSATRAARPTARYRRCRTAPTFPQTRSPTRIRLASPPRSCCLRATGSSPGSGSAKC